ncbi:hypothetical protein GQ457_09G016480 [Hibiscus cannabinus]
MDRTEMKLQNQDATLKSLETQVGQISQILNTRPIDGFPNDTEVAKGATHEQCKAIATRSRRVLEPTNKQRGTITAQTKTSVVTDTPAMANIPTKADEDHIDPTYKKEAGPTAEASQPEPIRPDKLEEIRPPPPFPQRLKKQKQDYQFKKFFDILKQVKIDVFRTEKYCGGLEDCQMIEETLELEPETKSTCPDREVLRNSGSIDTNIAEAQINPETVTSWWVCMDYRKLNKATRKDHFPLPFIDQMLDRLEGKPFYCFLDGYSGYNQIAIAPEDQSKTTFTCPYGTFAFKRMPFGLCNAPATFQRCMTAIFSDMNEDCLEIFMDDFSTFGDDFDSCLSNLEKVLTRCKESNLVLNCEKMPQMKELQFEFDDACTKAFEILKNKLVITPIVAPPDWTFPIELMCDASDYAVGAVLGQRKGKVLPHRS